MPAARRSDAIAAQAHRVSGACWRIVEGQHHVSTLALVDSIAEQQRLEELIETTKPALPEECIGLHYLLSTPFRYGPYPTGSRFRRAGMTPGVFYASAAVETAVAEAVFYRLLFFAESPETPWPAGAAEHTAFSVRYGSARAVDLTRPPLARNRARWIHPTEYAPCQKLAEAARAAGIEVIRFASVRDPDHRLNVALLTCRAFRARSPGEIQSWRIRLGPAGIQAVREFSPASLEFGRDAFAADGRIAGFRWER
ncbi:MAG TPA: RES family NAD+ phosphorylase [Dongiaceae bacterium]|nr:RES family NAD+ phosphorylase [Dongiaceae bacterium]